MHLAYRIQQVIYHDRVYVITFVKSFWFALRLVYQSMTCLLYVYLLVCVYVFSLGACDLNSQEWTTGKHRTVMSFPSYEVPS